MIRTAILVDGGFYNKRATYLFGKKDPKERANELVSYCMRHLGDEKLGNKHSKKDDEQVYTEKKILYRIFYYDCPPSNKRIMHPLTRKTIDLAKSEQYKWTNDFFLELSQKRKVAIRKGELLESTAGYTLKPDTIKKLCNKKITIDDLTEFDFSLDIQQKGVDMKIGLDISSLAHKHLVDQIVLIAGDSDFVPAAKYARREGIDFILDPMWHTIKPSLNEHIDGLKTCTGKPGTDSKDPLIKKE